MAENYLVLARKYRPISFADLKGQEFLVTTIVNSIKLNRIAHTFLLTGIRGGGKTTSARIIARTLNCTSPIINEKLVLPCGECDNCKSSFLGTHPDIIELDAASRTGVNDVREIIENTNYSPLLGKYKIYIIDEVHMLSNSAFNALLKTLEEPPAHVKFIFATTELRKIPITILSRCQKFELRRLNQEQLFEHLKDILNKENIKADDDALHLIALHATGSVRDSLSLLDLVISNANNSLITKNQVRDLLGYGNNTQAISLLHEIIVGNVLEGLRLVKEFYYEGKDLIYLLQQLMELIHVVTKIKLKAEVDSFEYSVEEFQRLGVLAENNSIPTLTVIWQMLLKGIEELRVSNNQLISVEMVIIRLCHLANIPTPAALIEKINNSASGQLVESNPIKMQPSSIRAKLVINSFEELVQLFYTKREMLLYQYLINDVHLIEFEPFKIKIRHTNEVPHHFAKRVAVFLEEWTGSKWSIVVSSEGGDETLSEKANSAKIARIQELMHHDMMKEVLKNFPDAKIKDINSH